MRCTLYVHVCATVELAIIVLCCVLQCVDAELCVSSSGAGQPGPSPSSPGGEVGVVLPPLSQTSLPCSLRPKHTGIVER